MRQRQVPAAALETRTIDLLTEIATRYYLRDEAQVEIARDLGLDPSTVSRYLKRARDEGIVHVEIRPPRRHEIDLGRELAARHGLARVIVAPTSDEDEALGAVAAEFIEGLLRRGMHLGISWGRTLAGVVRQLRPGAVADLRIAQLAGGVEDPTPGIQGHEIVRRVAELYPGSRVHYLHAPAIVALEATATALLDDPMVEAALEAGRRSELALVGIGQMDESSTLYRGRHVNPEDWARLLAAGAIGDVNTRFFDAHGRSVGDLDGRTIGLTWEDLGRIPTVVAVAAGRGKVEAIRGALATGCIDILVTDEATALAVRAADKRARRALSAVPQRSGDDR